MKHVAFITALALATTLSACAPTPGPVCRAPDLQHLVGDPEAAAQALQHTGPVRIIHPGDMVTLDLIPNRLNFRINAAGRITSVTCG